MKTHSESASPGKAYAKFYERRRQYFDEIVFSDLEPVEKIYALAVAQIATRISDDGDLAGRPADSTYTGPPTIARRLGIDARKILSADRRLCELGRIKVENRRGREHRIFVLKNDAPMRSVKVGSKDLYRRRGKHIEQVLFDGLLTPAQRVIGIALTGLSRDTSLSALATYLHIARKTATRATDPLVDRGHFRRITADTDRPFYAGTLWSRERHEQARACTTPHWDIAEPTSGHGVGHDLGHQVAASDCSGSENHPISGNSLNTPSPTDSATFAARNVAACSSSEPTNVEHLPIQLRSSSDWRERFTMKELGDFVEICGVLEDNSHCTGKKTIAGIVAVADWRQDYWVTFSRIQTFVRAGLLDRDGDVVSVSEVGWQAYDWFSAQDGQREVAA